VTTKEEKKQHKALRQKIARQQRTEAEAKMPISKPDLKSLFDYLDEELAEDGCNESLRITTRFLTERNLPEQSIIAWLGEYGGYCDCEVLANVESEWDDFLGEEGPV
jgi:hypothetical protein